MLLLSPYRGRFFKELRIVSINITEYTLQIDNNN